MSEIPVTEEMIAAASGLYAHAGSVSKERFAMIYRAMAEAAPKANNALIIDGWQVQAKRIAALEEQRNEVVDRLAKVEAECKALFNECVERRGACVELKEENAVLRNSGALVIESAEVIRSKDARIHQLEAVARMDEPEVVDLVKWLCELQDRVAALEEQRNDLINRLAKAQNDRDQAKAERHQARAERDAWQKLHGDADAEVATLLRQLTDLATRRYADGKVAAKWEARIEAEHRAFPAAALRASRSHPGRME